ncbi:mitochondrial sodium/calcium exchanger protein-like [Scaptodrosophila lebanonensis]|uniref:Mitochondrial sodium/calcium exchanger protein-like n=1 Tax=Drosophila lebanonensis TaxID=7225 RepID=A0A6J2ULJ1_DROLE|nr:mitochondrial sodium/calcium exchanger protein-like [Scaptodrosophila lebanonensis]
MGDTRNDTFLDEDFETYLKKMSCLAVMRVEYDERCELARGVEDCKNIINLFNYFEMMYCKFHISNKTTEIAVMCIFMLGVLGFLMLMGHVVGTYFGPALKILSKKMHMSEYLAGATLLAFGNASPDIFANLMPIRADAAIFTITIGNAVSIILISGGTVCFLKPFKMNGHSTVRDLLFLLLACEILRFVVFFGGKVTIIESIILISVYVVYLFINILDLILSRISIRKLQKDITTLKQQPNTLERNQKLMKKQTELYDLVKDDRVEINDNDTYIFGSRIRRSSWGNSRRSSTYVGDKLSYGIGTRKADPRPAIIDIEATRTILHNETNPKNLYLFKEFFESLVPIDLDEWSTRGCFGRFIIILRSPIVFVYTVFVPVIDYELDKHGWSKLLNCTQIITNPAILITIVHSMLKWTYDSWYIRLNFDYSQYSLCITVPLAIIVFWHSRTDLPPPYHFLFVILSGISSMITILVCATEIEVLSSIVGIVFNLTANYMAITFGSLANATSDMMANVALAMQGYEKMAYAAIFGGPFFSMLVGMGVAFYFNKNVREKGSSFWLYGEHGENCYVFLVITIVCTLWWLFTFNFFARRSAGLFSYLLYSIFLLYATLIELDWVHEFADDQMFDPE